MGAAESYRAVPYEGGVYPQTHPDVLATVSALVGLQPAHPARCRVLELGCADGANLLGMAAYLPESTFVGLDAAANHIATGEAMRRAVGLDNVRLAVGDIANPPPLGTFDYIIAHGIYSWIPAPVRAAMLRLCHDHLAPHGVAYISYNTLPGWHQALPIRDLMRFHTRNLTDPAEIVAQGRSVVDFAAEASGRLLHTSASAYLATLPDDYVFHDMMEDINEPVALHTFIEHAGAAGLQYIGDAELARSLDLNFPEPTRAVLHQLSQDPVVIEQYMDFLTNRTLRRTLLCRSDVPLRRALDPAVLQRLRVALPLTEVKELVEGTAYRRPGNPEDMVIATEPWQRALLEPLRRCWPASQPLSGMAPRAVELLLACVLRGFADLRTWDAPVVRQPPAQPVVVPLVREQARQNLPLTSALLQGVQVSAAADRALVASLDGTVTPPPGHEAALARLGRLGLLVR